MVGRPAFRVSLISQRPYARRSNERSSLVSALPRPTARRILMTRSVMIPLSSLTAIQRTASHCRIISPESRREVVEKLREFAIERFKNLAAEKTHSARLTNFEAAFPGSFHFIGLHHARRL